MATTVAVGSITIIDVMDGASGGSLAVSFSKALSFTATDGVLDASQANITFTANSNGVTVSTYLWEFSGFATSPTNSGTYAQTVTAAQFGSSKSATVTCTINGEYSESFTIVRLEKSTAAAGATVGAPTGTYVGSVLAETVAGKANGALQKAGDAITGPVTFATNGGILAATDADNGVFMGPNGLVGKKAGATTFAIDTAGNASFGGALNAATGTFAGSLSAATGSFSGTLTADAISAVNTINIAGNAVTIPVAASGVSGALAYNYTRIVVSAVIDVPADAPVFISAQVTTTVTATGSSGACVATISMWRDGVQLTSIAGGAGDGWGKKRGVLPGIFSRVDSPGEGTHTYAITIQRSGDTSFTDVTYATPSLFVFVAKR